MTAALERGAHPTDAPAPTIEAADDRRSLGVMVWISVGWLVLLSLSALLADVLPLADPADTRAGIPLSIPTGQNWLGTDQLGRDLLARLLYGARISLLIALSAATISLVLGVLMGAVAGYFGGAVDDFVMWVINTATTIPDIYLLVMINAIFRPSPVILALFLGFLGWFGTARFMRGNVFKVRELDYTLAARALGARNTRILTQHIIPNSIPIVIVLTANSIGGLILAESILSFLGLGVQPPTASWGNMLFRANSFVFQRDPVTQQLQGLHLLLGPGLLTTFTVLAFSLMGDGLRDALDPTLRDKK